MRNWFQSYEWVLSLDTWLDQYNQSNKKHGKTGLTLRQAMLLFIPSHKWTPRNSQSVQWRFDNPAAKGRKYQENLPLKLFSFSIIHSSLVVIFKVSQSKFNFLLSWQHPQMTPYNMWILAHLIRTQNIWLQSQTGYLHRHSTTQAILPTNSVEKRCLQVC